MKKIILFALSAVIAFTAGAQNNQNIHNKTAIVAHRAYWQCEQAGNSQNSIAALKAAGEAGFWGCELDIYLTADGYILVDHDGWTNGKSIAAGKLSDFDNELLPNGERRPTLDEYLAVAKQYKNTKLVIEFKMNNDELIDKTVKALKKYKMFRPDRVLFIAFNYDVCKKVAAKYPKFTIQYLNGDKSPAELLADGINGLDYGFWVFRDHPEWVEQAHKLGMSVNVWTVDYDGIFDEMLVLGVDQITTNIPMDLRYKLGDLELKF